MNTGDLIREARAGSAAAQKCIFDLMADKMLVVCSRYVKKREDAEELLLDGFYKFFSNLPGFQYQGEAALYTWIKRIMINECLMFLRKKSVFNMVTEIDGRTEEIPFDENIFSRLSAAELHTLIVRLPAGYRTVFNLYAVEGLNHREIAELLDIAEGTSKSQLKKARTLLQKMVTQKGESYVRRKTQ